MQRDAHARVALEGVDERLVAGGEGALEDLVEVANRLVVVNGEAKLERAHVRTFYRGSGVATR